VGQVTFAISPLIQRIPLARKILLADDSVTAQNMGRKILADAGYEVITVNNGSAALKKINEIKPDLIVLDVYMPGYSGLEVCQRLKETGDTARIPILLTVGKLEPFKPEEAKRVRAEGFIVKPFEASELLSALTKLEDKIVPRAESSKPGRFARTIAAVEEGRYENGAPAEETSSWKNRISFPSQKKDKAAEQQDNLDSAIYNPVNKDLRTVLESKPSRTPEPAKANDAKTEESRVDLTALAPEGLPKDVTPEEIAALAAAAAQMQSKIADGKAEAGPSEVTAFETKSSAIESPEPEKIAESSLADRIVEEKIGEAKIENEAEAKSQPVVAEASTVVSAPEAVAISSTLAAPSDAEVTAAISALEPSGPAAQSPSSSNTDGAQDQSQPGEAEPVTMAMATADQVARPSRWTAVAVTLAPTESAIALEEEMRMAFAAHAACESAPAETAVSVSETKPAVEPASVAEHLASPGAVAESMSQNEGQHSETVLQAPMPEPQAFSTLSAAASAASDSMRAAVRNFETVSATSFAAPAPRAAEPEPAPTQTSAVEASAFADTKPAEPGAIESSKNEATSSEIKAAEATQAEIPAVQSAAGEPTVATGVASSSPQEQAQHEGTFERGEEVRHSESAPALSYPVAAAEELSEAAKTIQSDAVPAAAEPAATAEAVVGAEIAKSGESAASTHGTPNQESEIAATTAAAWASWRRIRESGDSQDEAQSSQTGGDQSSRDEAAMAVAAGAEKAPEEGPEIASIVDSVLADLRPKIVEEISRKLRKK
jgi:CheY-like chemotaxis protein